MSVYVPCVGVNGTRWRARSRYCRHSVVTRWRRRQRSCNANNITMWDRQTVTCNGSYTTMWRRQPQTCTQTATQPLWRRLNRVCIDENDPYKGVPEKG